MSMKSIQSNGGSGVRIETIIPYPVALSWAVVSSFLLLWSMSLLAVQLPTQCAPCDYVDGALSGTAGRREALLARRGGAGEGGVIGAGGSGAAATCTNWMSDSRWLRAGGDGGDSGGNVGGDSTSSASTVASPEVDEENAWAFTKWVPRVSPCPVAGLPIEEMDAHLNFRRGYTLGFSDDVEDKTQILPFLRAVVDPSMHTRKRRVLVDLGSNQFETSVQWFLRMYPLDFTEIHAVEVQAGLFQKPSTPPFQVVARELTPTSRLLGPGSGPAGFPDWLMRRVMSYNFFIDSEDDFEQGRVNVTRWLLDSLKLTEEDSVVVKMDIEGAEWAILPEWLADPRMPKIIDEIFVEVHYGHPSMEGFTWTPERFKWTLGETVTLLNDLRRAGFYVHTWP